MSTCSSCGRLAGYCTCGADEDDNSGPGGPAPNPKPNPAPDIQNEIDPIQYPCANSVLNKVINVNSDVTNVMRDVFGLSSDLNLKFVASSNLASDVDGVLKPSTSNHLQFDQSTKSVTGTLVIEVNTHVLENSTKEYMAVVYVHEALHAIADYMKEYGGADGNSLVNEYFPFFAANTAGGNTATNAQHLDMGMQYVTKMADVVKSMNIQYDYNRALMMAWGGLQLTGAYHLYFYNQPALLQYCNDVNYSERNSTADARGTHCN